MAVKLNALIVPFAVLGADDAYDIAYDADDVLGSPFAPLVKEALDRINPGMDYAESIPPITRLPGLGIPSLVPIPQQLNRIYIQFLPTIDAANVGCDVNDVQACSELYR
jgi:hypothetical protein